MKINIPFIKSFLSKYDYPDEAKAIFLDILEKIEGNSVYYALINLSISQFKRSGHLGKVELAPLSILSKLIGCSKYTIDFCLLLIMIEDAKKKFELANIPDDVFYNTFADLKYKCKECKDCKGVYGTFVTSWFAYYYNLKRFAYGRFQYEVKKYMLPVPFTFKSGRVIKSGDTFVNVHIPSSGIPLTDEIRKASYDEAYEKFYSLFNDGTVIFGCESWLLYPDNRKILPGDMNILKFMDDYETGKVITLPVFMDKWRIFGKDADKKNKDLPENTRLQKAYKDWLVNGGKTGVAFGWMEYTK